MPVAGGPVEAREFAGLLAPLGPFEPSPRLAVAVSGGADSLCLGLLADEWARARNGGIHALIVDHGLRPEAAAEARITLERLAARGVAASVLRLTDLPHGPGVAARAREARFAVLHAACADRGILHLLLGHHAGDQAETRLMREQAGSGPAGLACMAALRETGVARVLRPLLGVAPERLRATLTASRTAWVEDPSNADPAALRTRLRPAARANRDSLCAAAKAGGAERMATERRIAAELAEVALRPEGFAVVRRPRLSQAAWSALIQMVGGSPYPPPEEPVARLADDPRPCTLAGVRVARAPGDALLILRESAAIAAPSPARDGLLWDGRFRVRGEAGADVSVGALGQDAARLRDLSDLPATVLRTLPALRVGGAVAAVPHLAWRLPAGDANHACMGVRIAFEPPRPAACGPFVTAA